MFSRGACLAPSPGAQAQGRPHSHRAPGLGARRAPSGAVSMTVTWRGSYLQVLSAVEAGTMNY